ncbi:uncharacterized protein LOC141595983 isoform X2 [Silene latifolia]|uniref:uncharacterized protein LOC141595983 isoform X2 n=1 Tax=Silene latifolia TaxID=37657 RepID=UPI003D7704DC
MESRYEFLNGVQTLNSPNFMVDDNQMKEFNKYENGGVDKVDSFVIDLENVSSGQDNGPTSNPRISLQRNASRKVSQRGNGERKNNDFDILSSSLSPRDAQATTTPKKSLSPITIPTMGLHDNSVNHQLPQHQITIKTGGSNTVQEGRWGRRSSFKRSSASWFAHPKRILFFFATLSCMGTMLLIYFTLSMNKQDEKEGISDWQ